MELLLAQVGNAQTFTEGGRWWKVVEGGCGRRIHDTKVLEIGKKSIAISSKYHQSTTCPIGFTRSRSAIKTIGFVKCFSTSQGNQNPREEKCMVV